MFLNPDETQIAEFLLFAFSAQVAVLLPHFLQNIDPSCLCNTVPGAGVTRLHLLPLFILESPALTELDHGLVLLGHRPLAPDSIFCQTFG